MDVPVSVYLESLIPYVFNIRLSFSFLRNCPVPSGTIQPHELGSGIADMLSGGLTQKRQLLTAQDFIDIEQYFYTALHLGHPEDIVRF